MLWGYIKKYTKRTVNSPSPEAVRIRAFGPARGVLAAYADDTKFTIGYSLVNAKHDRFDIDLGMNLAEGRAKKLFFNKSQNIEKGEIPILLVPASILTQVNKFIARAKRYYPGKIQGFKIETFEDQLSEKELKRIAGVFDGDSVPDEKPAEEYQTVPLRVPAQLNELFLQAGKDSLILRKNRNKWEVVQA